MSINYIFDLLKSNRLRKSTGGNRGLLVDTESDKARVVNSSPFRRLQQKTQVFPLEYNAAVRSRLTHSLEVSQIGRYIVQSILKECNDIAYEQKTAFTNIVETACLLHDIGNPPFGHFGEAAIKDWVKERIDQQRSTNEIRQFGGLDRFDGNPQGLRIVSKLQGEDGFGLNLTATQLLSTIKYPCTSEDTRGYKKIGIFDSEKETYINACQAIGWEPWKRFPLVYLMEAADDIAYSLSDLEDGIEKKILRKSDLDHLLKDMGVTENGAINWFVDLKTKIINKAVALAASQFNNNIEALLAGEKVEMIPKQSDIKEILNKVGEITSQNVYRHHEVEEIELAGYSVISGILSHYERLLDMPFSHFGQLLLEDQQPKGCDVHARLFRRLPRSYVKNYMKYNVNIEENIARHQLIIDYVCGMTDDFSLTTYQNLKGIRVGDAR